MVLWQAKTGIDKQLFLFRSLQRSSRTKNVTGKAIAVAIDVTNSTLTAIYSHFAAITALPRAMRVVQDNLMAGVEHRIPF